MQTEQGNLVYIYFFIILTVLSISSYSSIISLSNFSWLFYSPCFLNSIRDHFISSLNALFWLGYYFLHLSIWKFFFPFFLLSWTLLKKLKSSLNRWWFLFKIFLLFPLSGRFDFFFLPLLYHQDLLRVTINLCYYSFINSFYDALLNDYCKKSHSRYLLSSDISGVTGVPINIAWGVQDLLLSSIPYVVAWFSPEKVCKWYQNSNEFLFTSTEVVN